MDLDQLKFRLMYRLRFTPWDGHGVPARFHELADTLPKGRALDIGCGTGDASIYLAKRGWRVTGVDFVERALACARAKASASGADARFVRGDVTHLRELSVGDSFSFIVDFGCLHGLDPARRAAYVKEVKGVAAPDATLLIVGFAPGERVGPSGFDRAELEQRFAPEFRLVESQRDPKLANATIPAADPAWYLLRRTPVRIAAVG